VFLGVSVSGREETHRSSRVLHAHDMPAVDLSDNEMAKLTGATSSAGARRRVPQTCTAFEFPERPGALMNFLNRMGSGWNISLFTSNHGADVARAGRAPGAGAASAAPCAGSCASWATIPMIAQSRLSRLPEWRLPRALALCQAGRLAEAEPLLKQVVAAAPVRRSGCSSSASR